MSLIPWRDHDKLRTRPAFDNLWEAIYKQGMLEVTIPKVEPTPSARIKVRRG